MKKPALTEGTMRSNVKKNTSTQVPIAPPPAPKPMNPKIPLFEFCGATFPANWILGFNFSRASKSVTIELPNKGKIKNVYKTGDEARDEYTLVMQQYERICREARGEPA